MECDQGEMVNQTYLLVRQVQVKWFRQLLERIPEIILEVPLTTFGPPFLVSLTFQSFFVHLCEPEKGKVSTQSISSSVR